MAKKVLKDNEDLNKLLSHLKDLLLPIQLEYQSKFNEMKWPIGFIIGCPRSGTTLALQWLASSGIFSYPTNILARFAYAPYFGALIQNMLFNKQFDYNEEFLDINSTVNFNSSLGKTKGALSVNEFQHFFRNYLNTYESRHFSEDELNTISFEDIKKGLASIEYAFNKPFITKAILIQLHITNLLSYIPKSLFIYIKREPIFIMQSLLIAREKYYGDKNVWWSVKPKEYEWLKNMDTYHQIAGQVYYTNNAILEELFNIPDNNKIELEYKEICKNPKKQFHNIQEKYKNLGFIIENSYNGPSKFDSGDIIKISEKELELFKDAYNNFRIKKNRTNI